MTWRSAEGGLGHATRNRGLSYFSSPTLHQMHNPESKSVADGIRKSSFGLSTFRLFDVSAFQRFDVSVRAYPPAGFLEKSTFGVAFAASGTSKYWASLTPAREAYNLPRTPRAKVFSALTFSL